MLQPNSGDSFIQVQRSPCCCGRVPVLLRYSACAAAVQCPCCCGTVPVSPCASCLPLRRGCFVAPSEQNSHEAATRFHILERQSRPIKGPRMTGTQSGAMEGNDFELVARVTPCAARSVSYFFLWSCGRPRARSFDCFCVRVRVVCLTVCVAQVRALSPWARRPFW